MIKWEGYSSDDNSWERESNLFCPELIAEFKSRQKLNKTKQALKRKIDTVSIQIKIGNVLTECPLDSFSYFISASKPRKRWKSGIGRKLSTSETEKEKKEYKIYSVGSINQIKGGTFLICPFKKL